MGLIKHDSTSNGTQHTGKNNTNTDSTGIHLVSRIMSKHDLDDNKREIKWSDNNIG